MASIQWKKRTNTRKPYIVYRYVDVNGKKKCGWIPCENKKEANLLIDDVRLAESEGREYVRPSEIQPAHVSYGQSDSAGIMTVRELLGKYVIIGAENWQPSTLHSHRSIIANYIDPFIGDVPLSAVTPRMVQDFYNDLPTHKAIKGHLWKRQPGNISARTVKEVHKILRPAFNLAQVWGECAINPTLPVKLPKQPHPERQQWSEEEVEEALRLCADEYLHLAIALQFSATTRSGELAGITWDKVDLSNPDEPTVDIDKTLRRLYKADIEATGTRDILAVFPQIKGGKTQMVLKRPKTETSIRRIYLPADVGQMLSAHRAVQNAQKEALGDDYHDYGLVFAQANGDPYDVKDLSKRFKSFCKRYGLRMVDFYSLRHAGATSKLRDSKNIKAVQGDMGHASPEMLTKVYATIVDEDRRNIAHGMQKKVFSKLKQDKQDTQ